MLKTVYFVIDKKVAKVIIDNKFMDYFLKMGAFRLERDARMEAKLIVKAEKRENAKRAAPKVEKREPTVSGRERSEFIDPKASRGDIGIGRPGTLPFHEATLLEMKEFDAIKEYTKNVTGNSPKKTSKSTIASYRRTAISMIRKFIKDGNQSG